jgi:Putative zinc-finger
MNDDADGVAGALRELAGEARRRQGPGAHLSPEALTTYHAGELTPAAEEGVQEHLAVCRHCARLLLDLPAFLEAPAAGLGSLDPEDDASWREITARLAGPTAAPGPRSATWTSHQPVARWSWTPLAAAAVLAGAALVAVPLWTIARRLSSPELPPATLEIATPEVLRGNTAPRPIPPAIVHAEAASTTLLLRLARPQPDLRFRLELFAAAAGTAGAAAGHSLPVPATKIVDAQTLLLVLPRRQLAPGRYDLRVLDAEQPSSEPLGEYHFDIVEP